MSGVSGWRWGDSFHNYHSLVWFIMGTMPDWTKTGWTCTYIAGHWVSRTSTLLSPKSDLSFSNTLGLNDVVFSQGKQATGLLVSDCNFVNMTIISMTVVSPPACPGHCCCKQRSLPKLEDFGYSESTLADWASMPRREWGQAPQPPSYLWVPPPPTLLSAVALECGSQPGQRPS